MDKHKITNADLGKALLAFGYKLTRRGAHSIFRHPKGNQNLVLPMSRPNELAMPTHVRIAETVLAADEIATAEDFRFYLQYGKFPNEIIQRGDRLIWTEPSTGKELNVIAAAGEMDGMVIIKQKGSFSPCPVDQLRKVS